MTMESLGNLGDFISSLAVLVTLVYLSVQTKQMVKTSQQQSHSDILARRQELMTLLMDRDFIEVYGKGCSRLPLDALDAQRFTSFAISFLSHTQDTWIQYRAGLIDEQVWHAESSIMAVSFTQPGFLDWWEHGRQFLIPEFARVIERVKTTNLVLYDPDTHTWSRPQEGRFARDARVATRAS
jgi:hypothetical protein